MGVFKKKLAFSHATHRILPTRTSNGWRAPRRAPLGEPPKPHADGTLYRTSVKQRSFGGLCMPSMARSLSFDLARAATVHRNLDPDSLHRLALQEDQCLETETGALVAYSGKYTGRSPKDKAVVRRPEIEADIWWENNAPMEPEVFEGLRDHLFRYAEGKTLYVVDAFAGADPRYRIKVRFVLERAYHALFIRDLMIRPGQEELEGFEPDWTVYDFGKCSLDPAEVGTRSDAAIALDFQDRQVLIAGTEYAGEIKKSVFTIMNYLLPKQGVLSMHCSANQGKEGDVALFFGLSGTGKTTLSADPERSLIGDDEHGWSDYGVFNIEGGCYAKCIHLSEEREPQIYRAVRRGAVLENVPLKDGVPDYEDVRYTENTRCAYPLDHIENALQPSVGGHPKNIVFLTCDALGVLPRSRASTASKPCTGSSAATPPRWRARRRASRSLRSPSALASARRSCPCTPRCTRRCSARRWTATGSASGC